MSRGKKVLAGLIIAIVVFAVAVIVSERQNSDTQKKEHPLFVGHGKMQEVKYLNGNGAFYNDDYIFLDMALEREWARNSIVCREKMSRTSRN